MSAGAEAVRAFVDAFNDEDVDALVAVLDPEAEIQTSRGIVIGHDEARRWATRKPFGELRQRLVIDAIRDEGPHVIAFLRRHWYWREDGDVADESELTAVATLRDAKIVRWQPFEDRDEALRAAGVTA